MSPFKQWLIIIMFGLMALMLVKSASAQRTVRLYPNGHDGKPKWTNITAGSSATFDFYLNANSLDRHRYNGFVAAVCWTDTADGGAGARDSLRIVAKALYHDENAGEFTAPGGTDGEPAQYETGTPGLFVSGKDSINIANYINWGAGHSDEVWTISAVLNFQPLHAFRVIADNAGAAVNLRCEAHYNQGS